MVVLMGSTTWWFHKFLEIVESDNLKFLLALLSGELILGELFAIFASSLLSLRVVCLVSDLAG